jgi:hypothetical protein
LYCILYYFYAAAKKKFGKSQRVLKFDDAIEQSSDIERVDTDEEEEEEVDTCSSFKMNSFLLHMGPPWEDDTKGISEAEYDLEFGIAQVVADVPDLTGVKPLTVRVRYFRCTSGNVNGKWQAAIKSNGTSFEGKLIFV